MPSLLMLLALAGCSLFNQTDEDNDGIVTPADCNDKDATVYPGATEICDGIDNDCDGTTDVSATDEITWYADADDDGFGNVLYTSTGCTQPVGYVNNKNDCNDTASAARPGGVELCDGIDNDCDGTTDTKAVDSNTYYLDTDKDGYGVASSAVTGCTAPLGYVVNGTDCNDNSNIIYPTAPEICDNLDNDCDGDVDGNPTNPTTFYHDADGDTYGGTSFIVAACVAPGGKFVTNNTDCDDLEPAAYPGNTEVCDGVDNNCNGMIDDSPTNPTTFYADTDKDGYGTASTSQNGCVAPSGYVANKTDCNDTSATSYPGAPETCDALDNDCDGSIDENASNATTWYIDIDGDTFGALRYPLKACAQPSGYVNNSTDCDDVNSSRYPNAPEICRDGVVNKCGATALSALGTCRAPFPTRLAASTGTINGTATNDFAGGAIDGAGDFNGDGFGDILVGADGVSSAAGGAYLYFGSLSTTVTLTGADRIFTGITAGDRAGISVSSAGRVNKDSYDDILIGADSRNNKAGAVYLILGGPTVTGKSLSSADATFTGISSNDLAGYSVADIGDTNKDTFGDFIIGAPGVNSGAGAAYVIRGDVWGTLSLSAADIRFAGTSAGDGAGSSVSGAGDINGDGLDDMLIGADGISSNTGGAYVSLGDSTVSGAVALSAASVVISGVASGDKVGASVSSAGDFNGDGYDDIILGAPGVSTNTGAVYLILGSKTPSAAVSVSAAQATFTGIASGDKAGTAVSDVGDINGDGFADIAIGATGVSTNTGATYLYHGSSSTSGTIALSRASLTLAGTSSGDLAGSAIAHANDANKDGISDILIGAEGRNTNTGAVYLLAPFAEY